MWTPDVIRFEDPPTTVSGLIPRSWIRKYMFLLNDSFSPKTRRNERPKQNGTSSRKKMPSPTALKNLVQIASVSPDAWFSIAEERVPSFHTLIDLSSATSASSASSSAQDTATSIDTTALQQQFLVRTELDTELANADTPCDVHDLVADDYLPGSDPRNVTAANDAWKTQFREFVLQGSGALTTYSKPYCFADKTADAWWERSVKQWSEYKVFGIDDEVAAGEGSSGEGGRRQDDDDDFSAVDSVYPRRILGIATQGMRLKNGYSSSVQWYKIQYKNVLEGGKDGTTNTNTGEDLRLSRQSVALTTSETEGSSETAGSSLDVLELLDGSATVPVAGVDGEIDEAKETLADEAFLFDVSNSLVLDQKADAAPVPSVAVQEGASGLQDFYCGRDRDGDSLENVDMNANAAAAATNKEHTEGGTTSTKPRPLYTPWKSKTHRKLEVAASEELGVVFAETDHLTAEYSQDLYELGGSGGVRGSWWWRKESISRPGAGLCLEREKRIEGVRQLKEHYGAGGGGGGGGGDTNVKGNSEGILGESESQARVGYELPDESEWRDVLYFDSAHLDHLEGEGTNAPRRTSLVFPGNSAAAPFALKVNIFAEPFEATHVRLIPVTEEGEPMSWSAGEASALRWRLFR